MASIEKRLLKGGEVSYLARVRMAGFPDAVATFNRLNKAKAWAAKIETNYREGKYELENQAKLHSVAEVIDRYIETVLFMKSEKKRFLEQQKKQLLWWRARVGEYTLANCTAYVLAEGRDELVKSGKKPGTVNRYLAALSHPFTVCRKEWGWIGANPMTNVNRLKEPRERVRFLSAIERGALKESCRKVEKKPLYLIMMLALYTGARKKEILTAMIEDVDLKRGMIAVHDTKNSESRALYVKGEALRLLTEYMARLRRKNGLLFATRNKQPMNIDNEFRQAVRAGRIKNFRFHDLRHTYASYMAMSGKSLAEIAEALGHKTLNMVKRYAHLCKTHMSEAVGDMVEVMLEGEK